ncbi:GNAT family N-acetyltransferase [Nocardiopsis oceani]
MLIRRYEQRDAAATLDVFVGAVTETASADYSPEQIAAWAGPERPDLDRWNSARQKLETFVAEIDGTVAGFADVSETGYVDMVFVSPRAGRRGVATALLDQVRERALSRGNSELSTHASITAKPFFARHGFAVVEERHPVVKGVEMTNYRMVLDLDGAGREIR